ncbi:MAG: regulatory protein RecX [Bacillota bacterium]|nr:regulatory protein RecX [Bacillota bacterium]
MDYDKALQYAIYLLSLHSYTTKSLREKLQRKNYAESIVEQVLDFLIREHYLDDRRYAEEYIRTRSSAHGLLRMKRALASKGVTKDAIDTALDALEEQGESLDEAETALQLACRKLRGLTLPEDTRERMKLRDKVLRFLAGRGFSYSVSVEAWREAVRRLFDEAIDEDGPTVE